MIKPINPINISEKTAISKEFLLAHRFSWLHGNESADDVGSRKIEIIFSDGIKEAIVSIKVKVKDVVTEFAPFFSFKKTIGCTKHTYINEDPQIPHVTWWKAHDLSVHAVKQCYFLSSKFWIQYLVFKLVCMGRHHFVHCRNFYLKLIAGSRIFRKLYLYIMRRNPWTW